jgi:hypothetical protein
MDVTSNPLRNAVSFESWRLLKQIVQSATVKLGSAVRPLRTVNERERYEAELASRVTAHLCFGMMMMESGSRAAPPLIGAPVEH